MIKIYKRRLGIRYVCASYSSDFYALYMSTSGVLCVNRKGLSDSYRGTLVASFARGEWVSAIDESQA